MKGFQATQLTSPALCKLRVPRFNTANKTVVSKCPFQVMGQQSSHLIIKGKKIKPKVGNYGYHSINQAYEEAMSE
jgi:hypothetical protein